MDSARTVRLLVNAATAKPNPSIGQALGQLGVNMMMFCKDFNSKTTHYVNDVPLRVRFTAFPDKTFKFVPLAPPSTWFIKQAAGIHTGAAAPNKECVGTVHVKQLYEIAKIKKSIEPNLAETPLEGYVRSLVATCATMGVGVDCSKRDLPPGTKRSPAPAMKAAAAAGGKKKKK